MGISTLKGMRKEQARQELTAYGYQVIRHRLNALDTDRAMQLLLNRMMKANNEDIKETWHKIKCELWKINNYARVKGLEDKERVNDDLVVCLKHIDPSSPLYNEQDKPE